MKHLSYKELNESTFKTIKADDESNPIGCYFVGWQDGFELYVIKVEFCDSMVINEQDAFEAAEEISKRKGCADYIKKQMYKSNVINAS